MGFSRSPNFACTQSRSKKRDDKKASVAPMADANETSTKPLPKPKIAPPINVMMAAPGSDRAATAT